MTMKTLNHLFHCYILPLVMPVSETSNPIEEELKKIRESIDKAKHYLIGGNKAPYIFGVWQSPSPSLRLLFTGETESGWYEAILRGEGEVVYPSDAKTTRLFLVEGKLFKGEQLVQLNGWTSFSKHNTLRMEGEVLIRWK